MDELLCAIERARLEADPYLEGICAVGGSLDIGEDLRYFEFHNVELEGCVLAGANLAKASFYDCILTGTDLSNADLTEAFMTRTRLIGCKLEGTQLIRAYLRGCVLRDCQCRYLSAGEAKFENVRISTCDLREAFLSELRLRARSRFESCDLRRADFFRTSLKGIDLSTCTIEGIAVSDTRSELKGLIIAPEQAPDIAAMLGVTIRYD